MTTTIPIEARYLVCFTIDAAY
jgi:hypothetical protein